MSYVIIIFDRELFALIEGFINMREVRKVSYYWCGIVGQQEEMRNVFFSFYFMLLKQ